MITEQLPSKQNPENNPLNNRAGGLIGRMALKGEAAQDSGLPWVIGANGVNQLPNAALTTTLPEEAFRTDIEGRVYIPATALDLLTEGVYKLTVPGSSGVITVLEIDGGLFVKASSSRNDNFNRPEENRDASKAIETRNLPVNFGSSGIAEGFANQLSGRDDADRAGVKILESIGYRFNDTSEGRTIPTPATLEKIIKNSNIPVEIIDEADSTGIIPTRAYLGCFARGKYPIGVADLGVYAHDVRANDHIVGVVLLGNEGLGMLDSVAESALRQLDSLDNRDRIQVIQFFDSVTAVLSGIVDQPFSEFSIETFGKEGNSKKAAEQLAHLCRTMAEAAEVVKVEFDPDAMFEYLKKRLKDLNSELVLGEDFELFLAEADKQSVPEPIWQNKRSKELLDVG